MKLYESITNENWTQGSFARDGDDSAVGTKNPRAEKWCLMGHQYRLGIAETPTLVKAIQALFPERIWFESNYRDIITSFNDDRRTKVEDVIRVCKLADV